MISKEREYRNFKIEVRQAEEGEESYKVRGYASTFDPYVLWEGDDGVQYSEKVDPDAYRDADLSDVIFLYNHEGMVYARNKNNTMTLSVDEHGLLVEADLSSTEQSRQLYEAIKTGLVDQMSIGFTVAEDGYDRDTHTRTILRFRKLYDVSAVSIPANPGTDIAAVSARDYFHGVMEAEKAERLEEQRQLDVAKAKYHFYGGN